MKKILLISSIIFIIGLLIEIIYSFYPLFIDDEKAMLGGLKSGLIIMFVGGIILLIELCFERIKEYKNFKKEIKKEDLIP